VIQRQLPAAVDAAVADPAHGRLAGIIDALATTFGQPARPARNRRSPPDPHRPQRRRRESGGTADRTNTSLSTGAEFFALMLDGTPPDRVAALPAGLPRGCRSAIAQVDRP
jgi:hypothetical protein